MGIEVFKHLVGEVEDVVEVVGDYILKNFLVEGRVVVDQDIPKSNHAFHLLGQIIVDYSGLPQFFE